MPLAAENVVDGSQAEDTPVEENEESEVAKK